jgi:heme/copper-type cytochrome/quinol oxidase subunit 2
MRPWVRWAIIGATIVGVVVLFVALSPGEASDDGSPTPSRSVSPSVDGGSPSVSPTPPPPPEPTAIEVTVQGSTVRGPDRPTVTQGDEVQIVVRADVSDHVHVHGYDLMADVAPGEPARIRFVADVAGVFEVELEDAGRLLFRLEVRP